MNIHESMQDILLKKKEVIIHSKKQYARLTPAQHEALSLYKLSGYILINKLLRDDPDITYEFEGLRRQLHTNESQKDNKLLDYFTKKRGKMRVNHFYRFMHHYGPERIVSLIRAIDSIFFKPSWPRLKSFKIDTLYRGIAIPLEQIKLVGSTITFNDFLSTSFHNHVPLRFLNNIMEEGIKGKLPVILILKKCDNLPVIFLDWRSMHTKNLEKLKYNGSDEFELLLPRGCIFKIVKKYKYPLSAFKERFLYTQYEQLNPFYNDIQNLSPAFFKEPEIKDLLKKQKIQVMELELVKWDRPKPVELSDIPLRVELDPAMLVVEGTAVTPKKRVSVTKKKKQTTKPIHH